MIKCPFCDFENEDNASEGIACGNLLLNEETSLSPNEEKVNVEKGNEEYAVFISGGELLSSAYRKKSALKKTLKAELKCSNEEIKRILKKDYVRGLSLKQAERLAKLLQDDCSFVKAVGLDVIAQIDDAIKRQYIWRVKLLAWGQYKDAAVNFFLQYIVGGKEYVNVEMLEDYVSTKKKENWRMQTRWRVEAEEFASKLQSMGCETEIVKVRVQRRTNWLSRWLNGKYKYFEEF